jgi:hypothetical protein
VLSVEPGELGSSTLQVSLCSIHFGPKTPKGKYVPCRQDGTALHTPDSNLKLAGVASEFMLAVVQRGRTSKEQHLVVVELCRDVEKSPG